MPNHGLRLIREGDSGSRVVLDDDGLSADTRDSLERARLRELVRLLYVTLTRAKAALVIPWAEGRPDKNSFAWLWGVEPGSIGQLEPAQAGAGPSPDRAGEGGPAAAEVPGTPPAASPAPPLPARVLPHQLAREPDLARSSLHEASVDLPAPVRDSAIDPLDYGVWWHETLEFLPWDGDEDAVAAHGEASLAAAAEKGFGERGRAEWDRFLGSEPWRLMREGRWTRLAEAGIFAPLSPGQWIDGVIDLVLHDPAANEVWIVDWKTNRRAAGEADEDLLRRLCAEYEGQLAAYGTSAAGFFEGCRMSLWVYSTVAGLWAGVDAPP
jgi:ATP-dependent exoDNAse (exonuclease V) beta subunit